MVKLNSIEFEDLSNGLKCEKNNFNSDIMLLVGISGVGKSQILKAISRSFEYALNDSNKLYPFAATLDFSIDDRNYVWSYKVELTNDNSIEASLLSQKSHTFTYEKLSVNDETIMLRKSKKS